MNARGMRFKDFMFAGFGHDTNGGMMACRRCGGTWEEFVDFGGFLCADAVVVGLPPADGGGVCWKIAPHISRFSNARGFVLAGIARKMREEGIIAFGGEVVES